MLIILQHAYVDLKVTFDNGRFLENDYQGKGIFEDIRILWNLQIVEFIDIFVKKMTAFEPAISCLRDELAASAPDSKQVTERTFKLTPMHALVICQFL